MATGGGSDSASPHSSSAPVSPTLSPKLPPDETLMALLIAPRGSGKTTVISSLARELSRPQGILLSPVKKLPPRCPLRLVRIPAGPIGASTIARELATLPAGAFAGVDEFDTVVDAHVRPKDAIMKALAFLRNWELHTTFASKTWTGIPPWLRANANFIIYRPPKETAMIAWCNQRSLPIDALPDYHFYVCRPDGSHSVFCAPR